LTIREDGSLKLKRDPPWKDSIFSRAMSWRAGNFALTIEKPDAERLFQKVHEAEFLNSKFVYWPFDLIHGRIEKMVLRDAFGLPIHVAIFSTGGSTPDDMLDLQRCVDSLIEKYFGECTGVPSI